LLPDWRKRKGAETASRHRILDAVYFTLKARGGLA
jgi:hypothetical protein